MSELVPCEERLEQWKRHAQTSDKEVQALRTTVLAVVEVLNIIPHVVPSLLWSDALPAILRQIEAIVDQANTDATRAEKAEVALRKIVAFRHVLGESRAGDVEHLQSIARAALAEGPG